MCRNSKQRITDYSFELEGFPLHIIFKKQDSQIHRDLGKRVGRGLRGKSLQIGYSESIQYNKINGHQGLEMGTGINY